MEVVKLTIHSAGNSKYRFYIPCNASRVLFRKRKQKVILNIDNISFPTHTTCGPLDWNKLKKNQKKGYDLYSSDISKWIIDNKFHLKNIDGTSKNVSFTFVIQNELIKLFKI